MTAPTVSVTPKVTALEQVVKDKNRAIRSWKPLFNNAKYSEQDQRNVLTLIRNQMNCWSWNYDLHTDAGWILTGDAHIYSGNIALADLPSILVCTLFNSDTVTIARDAKAVDNIVRIARMIIKCNTSGKFARLNNRLGTVNYDRGSQIQLGMLDGITRMDSVPDSNSWNTIARSDLMHIENNIIHMKTSESASGMCAYIGNGADIHKRGIVYSKLGRAMRKLQPELTDDAVRIICNESLPAEVRICTSKEDVVHAYACDGGIAWNSCMHNEYVDEYYVAEVYANSPNAAVATLSNKNGTLMARSVVNTDTMMFSSIYGHHALRAKLIKMGYTEDSSFSIGLVLNRISVCDGDAVLMPFMDGDGVWFDDDEDLDTITMQDWDGCGQYEADSTDGYVYV